MTKSQCTTIKTEKKKNAALCGSDEQCLSVHLSTELSGGGDDSGDKKGIKNLNPRIKTRFWNRKWVLALGDWN